MSDTSPLPARPVSLFTVVFLFVVFAAFLFAVRYFYQPSATAPQNIALENVSSDEQKWRVSAETRRAALQDLRKKQAELAQSYGWVNREKGVVQLPIERAMQLVVQEHGAKK